MVFPIGCELDDLVGLHLAFDVHGHHAAPVFTVLKLESNASLASKALLWNPLICFKSLPQRQTVMELSQDRVFTIFSNIEGNARRVFLSLFLSRRLLKPVPEIIDAGKEIFCPCGHFRALVVVNHLLEKGLHESCISFHQGFEVSVRFNGNICGIFISIPAGFHLILEIIHSNCSRFQLNRIFLGDPLFVV